MRVTIREFERKDIPDKVRWINDEANNKYLHYDLPLEEEKTQEWFNQISKNHDRFDAIIEVDGESCGLIGLLDIDRKNGKAEFYIVLGEASCRGRGIAREATRKLIKYAFDELCLNKVYLFTEVGNIQAQRLFENAGFSREGLLRQDLKSRGTYVDRYAYGICRSDDDRG